jgi:hypothetical protein
MSNIFNSKKVAVTGKFNEFKRKDIEVRLVALGATISKSVSSNTDILVAGEKAGSKLQKAQSLGLDILDEAALMEAFKKIDSGSLAEAEQEAQAKAEKKAKPKELHEEIAAYLEKDRKEFGLGLGARLKAYFKTLAKRSDVNMQGAWRNGEPLSTAFGKQPSISSLNRWFKKLPTEYLAFLAEIGPCTIKWHFHDMGEQLRKDNYFEDDHALGILNIRPIERSPKWWPKQDWEEDFDYDSNLIFDYMADEGYAEYAYDPGEGPKDAKITFMNHNDVERYFMGSLNSYLQEGAKNAFVWYWQVQSWTGQNALDELKRRSIPSKISQKELLKQLEAKGCSKEETEALWKWLGSDAHILVALKDKV